MKSLHVLFIFVLLRFNNASRVIELTDKFLEIRKDGSPWFLMFYAPWCGHCKRIEPVWGHVAQALRKTNIRVGKVDCTRYANLASQYAVAAYPTLKFVKGDEEHTYNGDRRMEDMVNFALRLNGPPVQELTKSESMNTIKGQHDLFFMYVGEQEGNLWNVYHSVAKHFQPHGFFYAAPKDVAKQHVDLDELPAVFVYKENLHHFYTVESGSLLDDAEHLNTTMYKWINEERFETFPKITKGNIFELVQTKKYIVIAVLQENRLEHIPPDMLEFRDMVESVIRKKRDKYHKDFQFGWVASPEIANSIAMMILPVPSLIVLNSTTNHHYIPDDDPLHLTVEALDLFLEGVRNQSVPAYGGNGIFVRLYRIYFEARTTLAELWKGNAVLTVVIFGLPLTFLSLIIYNICCADIMDADEEEEETHEKKD